MPEVRTGVSPEVAGGEAGGEAAGEAGGEAGGVAGAEAGVEAGGEAGAEGVEKLCGSTRPIVQTAWPQSFSTRPAVANMC